MFRQEYLANPLGQKYDLLITLSGFGHTVFIGALLSFSDSTQAYIGPGLGVGAATIILGIFFGLFLILIGLIWYPIRKFLKLMKKNKKIPL